MRTKMLGLGLLAILSAGCSISSNPSAQAEPTPEPIQRRMKVLESYLDRDLNRGSYVTIIRDTHTGDEYMEIADGGHISVVRLTASGH